MEVLLNALTLIIPVMFTGIFHMIIVKKNMFNFLNYPVHSQMFGKNKTYRGFVVVPLLSTFFMLLATQTPSTIPFEHVSIPLLGMLIGFAYVLFELPNSFIKRRLNIPPGKTPKKFSLFFIFLDHTDSSIGCLLVCKIFLNVSWKLILITYLLGVVIHLTVNFILYLLKIRKNPL